MKMVFRNWIRALCTGPRAGAAQLAAIRGIKTPSKIAKLVMDHTTHVMIVGEGATHFAKDYGYKEEDLLTEKSRLAWLVWKQSLRSPSAFNNWISMDQNLSAENVPMKRLKETFPGVDEDTLAWAWDKAIHPTYGTINCLSLNEKGEMSGVTTTSGLAWKIPGRVGDSPIIGAGLFLDQDVGGAGSTGVGEENIRIAGGHTVVENMRHGMHPKDAVMDALKRVSRNYNDDKSKLAKLDIQFTRSEKTASTLRVRSGAAKTMSSIPSMTAAIAGTSHAFSISTKLNLRYDEASSMIWD